MNLEVVDISYSETFEKVFLAISFGTALFKMEYNPITITVDSSYLGNIYGVGFIKEQSSFTYIGMMNAASGTTLIAKLLGNGENTLNTAYSMMVRPETLTPDMTGTYSIVDNLPLTTGLAIPLTITSTALVAISPGTYQSNSSSRSNVAFQTQTPVSIYVQENFNGLVDFEFSCSASVTITADIVAHPDTGTFPSWVSVDPGMAHLNVSAPAFGQTNVYYFNVQETITGQTNDRSVELHVLGCNVDN